ncbi:MAG: amino acid ABC transporter substrate-binding protein [Azospirillaceae bacterium]|nr:amino acid ABC transporter substrate-binding protein [Azospirillaceae bacterium]
MKSISLCSIAFSVALTTVAGSAMAATTLEAVKARGSVQCGVNVGLPGFSAPDSTGKWSGLDVDYCRAVAAAVLGDAKKVSYIPLSAQQRFQALQSGEVDLLSRNTTWTLSRDTSTGFNFAPTTFYDGQGFMVAKSLGVKSAKDLNGATVCVQQGTTTELNLADYFRANGMTFKPVVIEQVDQTFDTFFSGRCDVVTDDSSALASERASAAKKPDDYLILPEIISKEPLAPAVRQGDDKWFAIVKWAVFATFDAEEKGISSANVDDFVKNSKDPDIQRILGVSPGLGAALGVDEKWAYNIIKQVGNYGEIFERNVGVNTPLKLERGLNAQWNKGGLIYAPPLR